MTEIDRPLRSTFRARGVGGLRNRQRYRAADGKV